MKSKRFFIQGTVQGVGFRPWAYRLARELNLKGFVRNTSQGVCMEIEGQDREVEDFINRIQSQPPVNCHMTRFLLSDIGPQGFDQFQILSSQDDHHNNALIMPDLAACKECRAEIFDPGNRRYLYPFTNCTHCGPRYSIVESLPYDRVNTSMKYFKMCALCQQEYDDPSDRRFHAEPNSCPCCGPQLALWDSKGLRVPSVLDTLSTAVELITEGAIVAVKGVGGFHLMADALNDKTVALLRERKARPHKPFAIMMRSLTMTELYCDVNPMEANLLESPQAPIVLLRKSSRSLHVSRQVALDNPYLGCMLPSTPYQHIILRKLNKPLVATSGNLSDEPMCIDNAEALDRLKNVADYVLGHDRPIVRQVDDSIVQLVHDRPSLIRRARGYAPLPVEISKSAEGILAVGAHHKNTVALGLGCEVIVSQHIGDLDNNVSSLNFEETISSLKSIYDKPFSKIACDLHPDYFSSRYAKEHSQGLFYVQHHHAHVASCMAENALRGEVLGICWDGTGLGPDGTVWGGEFLISDGPSFHRSAHLGLFPLPGGEQAVKEPRRSALGLLFGLCDGDWQIFKDLPCIKAFNANELTMMRQMIKQKINLPLTSSMGRLFDGVASLLGLCQQSSFEGQAAMALEFQVLTNLTLDPYPYDVFSSNPNSEIKCIDCSGLVQGVIKDIRLGVDRPYIATRFHQTLIEIIVDVAHLAGKSDVVLTGGCFQNKWLIENAINRLIKEGFTPYWHSQVPSNDGGISLGQIFVAAHKWSKHA